MPGDTRMLEGGTVRHAKGGTQARLCFRTVLGKKASWGLKFQGWRKEPSKAPLRPEHNSQEILFPFQPIRSPPAYRLMGLAPSCLHRKWEAVSL